MKLRNCCARSSSARLDSFPTPTSSSTAGPALPPSSRNVTCPRVSLFASPKGVLPAPAAEPAPEYAVDTRADVGWRLAGTGRPLAARRALTEPSGRRGVYTDPAALLELPRGGTGDGSVPTTAARCDRTAADMRSLGTKDTPGRCGLRAVRLDAPVVAPTPDWRSGPEPVSPPGGCGWRGRLPCDAPPYDEPVPYSRACSISRAFADGRSVSGRGERCPLLYSRPE